VSFIVGVINYLWLQLTVTDGTAERGVLVRRCIYQTEEVGVQHLSNESAEK